MKIEIILTKPKARTKIYFTTDEVDDWFININHTMKNGKVTRTSLVTQGRYMDWVESYLNAGWEIESGL